MTTHGEEPTMDRAAEAELFRQAFRRYASTVVLVTYFGADGRPSGLTATSMCSLSASPPSLLVCINRLTRAYSEITERGLYGINILSVGQRNVALHCSRPGMDKELRPEWLTEDSAELPTPRLKGSLAHLECAVGSSYEAYSHHVFLGLIQDAWLNPVPAAPLLYHGGAYGQLESPAELTERFHWELPG